MRKSPTPCRCGKRVAAGGKCADCLAKARRQTDRVRGSSDARGYGHRHRSTFRAEVLAREPLCRMCTDAGRSTTALVADHWPLSRVELVAQGYDPNDPLRGRALCIPCHNRHTGLTQGNANLRGSRPSR